MKRTALGGIALQDLKQLLNVTWRIGDHMYPPAVSAESLVDLPKFPTKVGGQCDFHGAHEAQTDALTCCACVLKICAIGAFAEDIYHCCSCTRRKAGACGMATKKLQRNLSHHLLQSM